MHTFTTLHRIVTYRDRHGNDHVQAYQVPVYNSVDGAVEHLGHDHVLNIINRAIATQSREGCRAALEYDVRHKDA